MLTVASDVGGTFTDVVLTGPDGRTHVAKTLTTPGDPAVGLLRGVARVLELAGAAPGEVGRFVHATTLATNVILERRGVSVAFVTTRGFRSMLALGRQARVEEERFDLAFRPAEPPVPLTRTFEVPERIAASGAVVVPLDEPAAERIAADVAALGVDAVAICLLHSYVNPAHERRLAALIAARLPAGTPVVVSSEVWPELGEYERATTTLMSAYVGPVMASYLHRLGTELRHLGITAPVHVVESAGGVLPASLAAARAVHTIESGPAAGVIAAARQGTERGLADLISFDMGGTTAKAGLVRGGRPGITHEFQVGGKGSFGGRRPGTGVPIKVPAIDLAEVGSGGGSIAWVDAGTLRVGPHSAGADPGPACYGRGRICVITDEDGPPGMGEERPPGVRGERSSGVRGERSPGTIMRRSSLPGPRPTVTDADLVLGYLDPDGFGEVRLSPDLARAAIAEHVAGPLGVDVLEAAAAIHDIANAQMGAAVHVVTVRRGIDPRDFTLVALGGAAPTHVARLAERFGIGRVLVPPHAGVGSAVGLLHSDLAIERAKTFLAPVNTVVAGSASRAALGELTAVFAELELAARADLSGSAGATETTGTTAEAVEAVEAVEAGPVAEVVRSVGIRFIGQAHAFTIELPAGPLTPAAIGQAAEEFYQRYRESYGIDLRDPAELTTARVRVILPAASSGPADPGQGTSAGAHPHRAGTRRAWFDGAFADVPVRARAGCAPGEELAGPCLITEPQASLVVPPGWRGTVDDGGAVLLEHTQGIA